VVASVTLLEAEWEAALEVEWVVASATLLEPEWEASATRLEVESVVASATLLEPEWEASSEVQWVGASVTLLEAEWEAALEVEWVVASATLLEAEWEARVSVLVYDQELVQALVPELGLASSLALLYTQAARPSVQASATCHLSMTKLPDTECTAKCHPRRHPETRSSRKENPDLNYYPREVEGTTPSLSASMLST
jgi:hypothetical protein